MKVADIRRSRLKEWFADNSFPKKEKSYFSQLISGKASFGERAARRIEKDYGMGEEYLDKVDTVPIGAEPSEIANFIKKAREALGLSQEALGEIFGCTKGNVSGWEKGLHEPKFAVLSDLSNRSKIALPGIGELTQVKSPTLKVDTLVENTVAFDLFDIQTAAGNGYQAKDFPQVLQRVNVRESWARQTLGGDLSRIKLITGNETSMQGTIENGDVLFVDVTVRHFDGDGIYVISRFNEIQVKRLQRLHGKKLAIISDNKDNLPETLNAQEANEVVVCGRVLAAWNLKRLWL